MILLRNNNSLGEVEKKTLRSHMLLESVKEYCFAKEVQMLEVFSKEMIEMFVEMYQRTLQDLKVVVDSFLKDEAAADHQTLSARLQRNDQGAQAG